MCTLRSMSQLMSSQVLTNTSAWLCLKWRDAFLMMLGESHLCRKSCETNQKWQTFQWQVPSCWISNNYYTEFYSASLDWKCPSPVSPPTCRNNRTAVTRKGHINDGHGTSGDMQVLCDKAKKDPDLSTNMLADAALYPTQRCVYYQQDQWRKQNPVHQNLESCWEMLEQKIPASLWWRVKSSPRQVKDECIHGKIAF